MKKNYKSKFLLTLCICALANLGWSQVTTFSYTGAVQLYTVPDGVSNIRIVTAGAQGGNGAGGSGGLGATMEGTFAVSGGDILEVIVGEAGSQYGNSGGGGGGTGVVFLGAPMIVAGGGGGGATNAVGTGGVITEDGGNSSGSGGTAGNGGEKGFSSGDCGWASGGGGFFGDGYGGNGAWDGGGLPGTLGGTGAGDAWTSGGSGGSNGGCTFTYPNEGAWGCGGGGAGSYGGAGGGGYSGGGGGQYVDGIANRGGAGGGSFNDGIDQLNTPANRAANGMASIEVLCSGLTLDIPVTGVCIGDELTLYAESETGGTITWSGPEAVTNGIAFEPGLGTFVYTAMSTSPDDCNYEVEISASEIPTITANSSADAACEGALITLWGEGGDTYVWSGDGDVTPEDSVAFEGEEGVITYSVIGSVLGCAAESVDIEIEGAPQPNAIAIADPAVICLGDSYTLTGGGDGAVDFDWGGTINDGDEITPEDVGTFVHTLIGISDVGCGDTTTVTVIVHEVPFVEAGLDMAQCVGMEVTLNGSGALTYDWDPAVTDGEAFVVSEGETTYTVTGTDANGCSDTDEIIVTGVGVPVITAVITDEFAAYTAEIDLTVTGGSGPYGYTWSHGPTTEDVTGLSAGVYMVTVDDIGVEDGICPVVDSIFTIMSFVGLEELNESNLSIYPNPAQDNVTISFEGEFTYEVTGLKGDLLLSGNAVDQELVSLEELAAGTYIVKVTANGTQSAARIIKQ